MKMQPRISFSVDSLLGRKTSYRKPEDEPITSSSFSTDLTEIRGGEEREEEEEEEGHTGHQDTRLGGDPHYVGHDSSRHLVKEEESEEEEEEEDLNVEDEDEDEELSHPLPALPLHLPLALRHPGHHPPPPLLLPSPPHSLLRPLYPPLSSASLHPFSRGFNPALFDKGDPLPLLYNARSNKAIVKLEDWL